MHAVGSHQFAHGNDGVHVEGVLLARLTRTFRRNESSLRTGWRSSSSRESTRAGFRHLPQDRLEIFNLAGLAEPERGGAHAL
eukprot:1111858-Pleurochrysis_carterae.AAC.1